MPRRSALLLATLVTVFVVAAGCAPDGGDDSVADGLTVMSAGADGVAGLTASVAGDDGVTPEPVGLPAPTTTWISAGRGNVLAATLADGSVQVSDRWLAGRGADLEWRALEAADASGDPPAGPLWFATWDHEGGRLAALAGDLPGGGPMSVVLLDPSTDTAFTIALDRPLLAAPPAWLDGEHLVVVGGTSDAPTTWVVDASTSEASPGPSGVRSVATSSDGSTIATIDAGATEISVRETAAWLAGDRSSIGTVAAPDGGAASRSFALDHTGGRLAIAWGTGDGRVVVDVHERADGWRRNASRTLDDGARGAVVGWLR
jgi:hypothetical protein